VPDTEAVVPVPAVLGRLWLLLRWDLDPRPPAAWFDRPSPLAACCLMRQNASASSAGLPVIHTESVLLAGTLQPMDIDGVNSALSDGLPVSHAEPV